MLGHAVATLQRRGPGIAPKTSSGLSQVEQIVAAEVQNRINVAARAAIAELEKLIK